MYILAVLFIITAKEFSKSIYRDLKYEDLKLGFDVCQNSCLIVPTGVMKTKNRSRVILLFVVIKN